MFLGVCLLSAWTLQAETGYNAWLRYVPLEGSALHQYDVNVPAVIVTAGDSKVVAQARDELVRGVRGMLGRTLRTESQMPKEPAILLGTLDELKRLMPQLPNAGQLDHGCLFLAKRTDRRRNVLGGDGHE